MKEKKSKYECYGWEEVQKFSSRLGMPVKTPFIADEGTEHFLIGIEYRQDYDFHWSWVGKIEITINGKTQTHHVSMRMIE